jgi:ParB family transcriptional regulator, chromosome partitioning protein
MATTEVAPQDNSALTIGELGERRQLPLSAVQPSPTNPRHYIDDNEIERLADNIQVVGLMEPIIVRPIHFDCMTGDVIPAETHPDAYEIVAGERRYRAHLILQKRDPMQFRTIDAIVRDLTDDQVLEQQGSENLQREDLTPLDWSAYYRALVERNKEKQAGSEQSAVAIVAGKMGVSVSLVYQTLQLANLIPEAAQALREEKISKNHAIDCARLEPEDQEAYLEECLFSFEETEESIGVRAMRRWVKEVIKPKNEPQESLFSNTVPSEQNTGKEGDVDSEDRARLKRFEDAISGRKLSGVAAHQITEALHGFGRLNGYSEGEKLGTRSKRALQDVCNELRARGIVPAETLLTECQQTAITRRKEDGNVPQLSQNRYVEQVETKRKEDRALVAAFVRQFAKAQREPSDLVAESLVRTVDQEQAKFICDLLGWVGLDASEWDESLLRLYYKNWAKDRWKFIVACAVSDVAFEPSTIDKLARDFGLDADRIRAQARGELPPDPETKAKKPEKKKPAPLKIKLSEGLARCTNFKKCGNFYKKTNKHPFCRDCQRKSNLSRTEKNAKKGRRK